MGGGERTGGGGGREGEGEGDLGGGAFGGGEETGREGGALPFSILGGGRRGLGGRRGGLALALEGERGLGCGFVFP